MNYNEIDTLMNKILVELHSLKSKKLKAMQLQDFNIDIIRKSTEQENKPTFSTRITTGNEQLFFGDKITLSKWKLKKRAKKIFKLQKKVVDGYISGIEKSIAIVENVYDKFLKEL